MATWDDSERAALVALLRTRPDDLNWSQITTEVAACGSAVALWNRLTQLTLFPSDDNDPDQALVAGHDEIRAWRNESFRFLTFQDPDYPEQLREVHQMPPVLFINGTLIPGEKAISVVGSRKASTIALKTAAQIAALLSEAGLTVLSGLAEGIDAAAHTAALDTGGRTVAIIGTGIKKYYPSINRSLQDRIASTGLVASQFWPEAPPTKQSFPMRNATMSAFGKATIIVEAGEQSGARIQARSAVAHGRPVILLDSVARGTNWGGNLRSQPGVFVAAGAHEAVELAKQIVFEENKLARLVAMAGEC
jgi:DNA processing protein